MVPPDHACARAAVCSMQHAVVKVCLLHGSAAVDWTLRLSMTAAIEAAVEPAQSARDGLTAPYGKCSQVAIAFGDGGQATEASRASELKCRATSTCSGEKATEASGAHREAKRALQDDDRENSKIAKAGIFASEGRRPSQWQRTEIR